MMELILSCPEEEFNEVKNTVELGLHHEMQHQELLLTDIKHIYAMNPLKPAYTNINNSTPSKKTENKALEFEGGLINLGTNNNDFTYDNERPSHKVYIEDFKIHTQLITNGEYLDFINDGGYRNFHLWHSEGWEILNQEGWNSPLYWESIDGQWHTMTLAGLKKLDLNEPVCHISFFEAYAFSKWKKKRLPTEAEWEYAAIKTTSDLKSCIFLESENYHPYTNNSKSEINNLFGSVWEWTSSSYLAYPGYKQPEGALGEYNGKFMCNQMVLKGGSCITPSMHIRSTYRNFFQCDKRWQFTGIRLAEDI